MAIAGPNPVIPHIKSGRLRALAVTSAQPSALFPDLLTVAASGLPGYEYLQINAMLAPAKTPDAIIRRLNEEIVRVLNRDDVKEKFLSTGTEVVGSSPEQLAAALKSDIARLGKAIKDAGIKAD
jgi:tripartite-type tricarboxylate transporter receptor subunit TctC